MLKKMRPKISFGLRLAVLLLMLITLFSVLHTLIQDARVDARLDSKEYRLEQLENDYLSEYYYNVLGDLQLYDLRGEDYEKYHEITDAYVLYLKGKTYQQAVEKGSDAVEKLDIDGKSYVQQLQTLCDKTEFKDNKKRMSKWLDEMR